MSGSELVHKFIGEARSLCDIFQMAREKAPSIIFIDEIDAVEAYETMTAPREAPRSTATMMQLLAEMTDLGPGETSRSIAARIESIFWILRCCGPVALKDH